MPKDCQYVTLSYVWGNIPSFMTTRSNIKELERPGILRTLAHQLPGTIRDAIDLVSMIGYRFLWIDRLCIVQDDEVISQANIWNMDRIYGQSVLVIIAADGDHADSGLSRTRSLTESHQPQNLLRIDPTMRLVTVSSSKRLRAGSTYQRRGWTYQEEFFAKRKLIFVGDRVFFECHNASWQEDTVLDDRMMQSKPNRPSITWQRGGSIYSSYRDSVYEFTSRQLTFPIDVMNAFAGVSNYWAESFGATMKYGLPNSVFDWAILWRGRPSLRQRQGEGCTFPTWSWAGWVGPVDMVDGLGDMQDWLTHHTWIIWYQWSPSLTALLWDVNHEREGRIRCGDASVGYRVSNTIDPFGRNKHRFLIDGRCQSEASAPFAKIEGLDAPHLPSFQPSNPGQLLIFWTMSAQFRLEPQKKNWTVTDRQGVASGYITHDLGTDTMQAGMHYDDQSFELIALSDAQNTAGRNDAGYQNAVEEARAQAVHEAEDKRMAVIDTGPGVKDPESWSLYYVMLITWRGPIAQRRGIGRIYRRAMKYALDPGPVWKQILLG
ncbi:MAG: hypothetical protein Q9208_008284 [Pyrenodesmia sp. 3 TL-2023]